MMLREVVSCEQLLTGKLTLPKYQDLGEIFAPIAYRRPKPIYTDISKIDPYSLEYYNLILKQEICEPKALHLLQFDQALILGQGAVVVDDKHLLFDSAAEFLNHGNVPDGLERIDLGFSVPHCEDRNMLVGVTALVKRPWYRNFGHWLVDLMPILPALSAASIPLDNILFGDVPPGNLRTIMEAVASRFFPEANIVFMKDAEQIRAERLLYFQPVHVPPLFKHPDAIELTRKAAVEIFLNRFQAGEKNRRLYVSRQRVGARSVTNAEPLERLLLNYEFITIYPEEMRFSEQIEKFQEADLIIGVKGAALTNIIFSKPGSHLLVLSPERFVDPFFWDLASQRGISYSEIFCESADPAALLPNTDVTVDIASIETFLSEI